MFQAGGQKGTIVSDILPFGADTTLCLSFWYHIQGATPAELTAKIVSVTGKIIKELFWWNVMRHMSTRPIVLELEN